MPGRLSVRNGEAGSPAAVEQRRLGVRLPSVAYLFRVRNGAVCQGNGAAFEEGVGSIPLAVGPGMSESIVLSAAGSTSLVYTNTSKHE